jgi:peptide chain release factor 1
MFMAENSLLEKVLSLQDKYKKLEQQLADPEVIADMKKFVQLNKDYKELQPIIAAGLEYKRLVDELAQAKDILINEKDEDLKEMAREEVADIEPRLPEIEQNIKLLLIHADPDDSKNAMVEIRGGTGGDEAAIFAGDLFRMYQHFAERRGWKLEVTDQAPGTSGGYKQIVFKLSSTQDGVYGVMKYESGVHRVQRVPQTETQGRIQTSAASVAVFPEAGEFDIELNPADIRKDLFCASGPGGQGVNTTYSAVRLTHIPSGIVVQCQEERSQLKNLDRAMEELRTRLYNMEHQKYLDGIAAKRKTMVSTGDRSAKIRTYNYPQGRVTDHRIGWSMYNLPVFMDGDIQECIDQLQIAENAERLKEAAEE